MSLSTCALSKTVLSHPVVSKKTGHVFEKSVIVKHLETTSQCPITGKEMSVDDLIDVSASRTGPAGRPAPRHARSSGRGDARRG